MTLRSALSVRRMRSRSHAWENCDQRRSPAKSTDVCDAHGQIWTASTKFDKGWGLRLSSWEALPMRQSATTNQDDQSWRQATRSELLSEPSGAHAGCKARLDTHIDYTARQQTCDKVRQPMVAELLFHQALSHEASCITLHRQRNMAASRSAVALHRRTFRLACSQFVALFTLSTW